MVGWPDKPRPGVSFVRCAGNEYAMGQLGRAIDTIAKTGATTYLKAIRFDGTNAPGFLINTQVKSGDESDLLLRVEALVETLWAVGVSKAKLNVFRVIDGDGSFTHLVSINLDSPGNAAKAMDAFGPVGWDAGGSVGRAVGV